MKTSCEFWDFHEGHDDDDGDYSYVILSFGALAFYH